MITPRVLIPARARVAVSVEHPLLLFRVISDNSCVSEVALVAFISICPQGTFGFREGY